jgi:hypothetical protein
MVTQKEQTINGVLTEIGYLPLDIQLAVFKELFVKFEGRIQIQIIVNDIVETIEESEEFIDSNEFDIMINKGHNSREFVDEQLLSDYIEPLS